MILFALPMTNTTGNGSLSPWHVLQEIFQVSILLLLRCMYMYVGCVLECDREDTYYALCFRFSLYYFVEIIIIVLL